MCVFVSVYVCLCVSVCVSVCKRVCVRARVRSCVREFWKVFDVSLLVATNQLSTRVCPSVRPSVGNQFFFSLLSLTYAVYVLVSTNFDVYGHIIGR